MEKLESLAFKHMVLGISEPHLVNSLDIKAQLLLIVSASKPVEHQYP